MVATVLKDYGVHSILISESTVSSVGQVDIA